jgi:hypothetical protein
VDQSELQNRADGDDEEFRFRLERLWDVAFVADISLNDGTLMSAVLIATSTKTLILDRWDCTTRSPAGDPFTLELAVVTGVTVP